ncbi:MAG: hypothetical protein ACR2N3_14905, partial [Pyrinomonadaceae bacterium]
MLNFDNLTQRNNLHWGIDYWQGNSNNISYAYQNNRITSGIGYVYDADGRITQTGYPDDSAESTYDASGQLVRI